MASDTIFNDQRETGQASQPPTAAIAEARATTEYHLLKAINEALLHLLSEGDKEVAMRSACEIVGNAIQCEGVVFLKFGEISEEKATLHTVYCLVKTEERWDRWTDFTLELPLEDERTRTNFYRVKDEDYISITSRAQNGPALTQILEQLGVGSYFSCRIVIDGQLWGIGSFASRSISLDWVESNMQILMPFLQSVGNFLARREAQEELKNQYDYFKQIIDSCPNPIFAKNREGFFTMVNQQIAKLHELTTEEMTGRNIQEFLPSKQEALEVLKEDAEIIDTGLPKLNMLRELTTVSGKRYIQISKLPIINPKGKIKEVITVLTDLTEQKKTETQLRAEKHFSERINSTITDWILLVDLNNRRFIYHNIKYPVLGYTEEEVSNPVEFLVSRLHPADKPLVKEFMQALTAATPEAIVEKRFRLQHKEGHWIHFYERARVTQRDEDGNIKEYFAVIQDITELKKTEIALQQNESILKATINALPDLKFRVAKDGTYLDFYESEYENMQPYAPPAVFMGKRIHDVMPSDMADLMMKYVLKALEERTIQVFEYDLSAPDRKTWYREIRICPINDQEVIAVVRDISKGKQAEMALQQSQDRYLNFIKHSHDGIYYMNCGEPIPIHLSFDEITHLYYKNAFIEECNDALARMYDTTVAKLRGTKAITLHSGEHYEENVQSFKDLIKNGFRVSDVETLEPDANGNLKYFLNNAVGIIENEHLIGFWGTQTDITERKQAQQRDQSRSQVLELLSKGASQATILEAIVLGAEQHEPGMIGSIILLDEEGKYLRTAAAPNLPDFYTKAIDGTAIGMGVGSCGTAAYTGERVIVEDIQTHPYWTDYKQLAAEAGLRSSWSEPIKDSSGNILGSFAIYHKKRSIPTEYDIEVIKQASDLTSIVLHKFHAEAVLKASEEKFYSMVHNISDIITLVDKDGIIIYQSYSIKQVLGFDEYELLGKSIFELLHPDDHALVAREFENTLAKEGNGNLIEFRFLNKAGHHVQLEAQGNNQLHNPAIKAIIVNSRDISKRKQEEAHLKLLQSAITNSNDAVMITEAEPFEEPGPRILYVNEAFTKMTGYTPAEVIGKTPRLLQGPKSDRVELARLKESFKKWESCVIETINYKKNGEEFWVQLTIVPIADEKGWFTHWVSIQRDTTERKKAEEYLRLSEERWKLAIEGSNDGMWDWNVVTNEVFFSARWKEMLGFGEQELPDHYDTWRKSVHPDDIGWITEELQKHFRHETPVYFIEHRLLCKNGTYKWILSKGKVLSWNTDGTPARMIGTHTDISERKQAEHALQENRSILKAIINALPDLKFRVNEAGLFLDYYESEYENEIPIIPPAEFIGKTMEEVLPSFVAELSMRSIQLAIENKRVQTFEYCLPLADEFYYYEGRVSPISEEEVIVGVRNISDQKKAQLALQEKLRELDEKNKQLTQYIESNFQLENFAYIASHDLREPVRTIHSFAQLMKKRYTHLLDEDGRKCLNFIIYGSENMNQLIEDLLTYSRVSSEEHKIEIVEIPALLEDITGGLARFIQEKNASISYHDLPLTIEANPTTLRRLFQNLLINAIKFHHPQRQPVIQISSIEHGKHWLFEVKDNGIGIPNDMQEKIFQLFKKVHYVKEHYGTGIGLAICKRITEQHGGEIWVESSPETGSSFYFTIQKQPDKNHTIHRTLVS